jgi:hypothetical protein
VEAGSKGQLTWPAPCPQMLLQLSILTFKVSIYTLFLVYFSMLGIEEGAWG